MANFKLPDGYTNLNQRAFQTWNADAKKFTTDETNIVDLEPFFVNPSDFDNGTTQQANSGLKLYRNLDGSVDMRGSVTYTGAGATSVGISFLTSLTSVLSALDIKSYISSSKILSARNPAVALGAFVPVNLVWETNDTFSIEVGTATLTTADEIFINFKFYPNSI